MNTPPTLDSAFAAFITALKSPGDGSAGAALADLVAAIDRTTGTTFGAAVAEILTVVDLPGAASGAQMHDVAPAQPSAAPGGLGAAIDELAATIAARAGENPQSSYTASLLAAGVEKCAKKLGEEAVETALAAAKGDKAAIAAEAADLLYHLVVLLRASGVDPGAVAAVLEARRGVSGHAEKAARPQG
jgi:phosphoribosyl-ATP pyrophosphohydrolase